MARGFCSRGIVPGRVCWILTCYLFLAGASVATAQLAAQQARPAPAPNAQDVRIDQASIGGVVLNSNGDTPEAGVWVIAETKTLPVPFRRIVVTDDRGRFVVPDLPSGATSYYGDRKIIKLHR